VKYRCPTDVELPSLKENRPMLGTLVALLLLPAQAEPTGTAKAAGVQELRIKKYTPDTKLGNDSLWVRVEIEGPAVAKALKYGNLKITKAVDDAGTDLHNAAGPNASDSVAMKAYSRLDRKSGKLPIDVKMKAPPRGAKSIALQGSIDLLTASDTTKAEFAGTKVDTEIDLKDPALEAAGVKIRVVKAPGPKNEKALTLLIDGNEDSFEDVEIDFAGKPARPASTAVAKAAGNKPRNRYFYFADKLPESFTLRVLLLKGAKTVTVKIDFEKLELP